MDPRIVLHYHGDKVRALFLIAGIVYILRVLFFRDLLMFPISVSVLAILLLSLMAGLINPRQLWTILLDSIISIIGFTYFQFMALAQPLGQINAWFVTINQVLAVIFFLATYFSIKSLRGILLQ